MAKPVILAVDDEAGVLAAVGRDLRREYGERFRIVRATSGTEALDTLKTLRLRDEPVALLLVDQRMPGMTGVELLARALDLYPNAKRVLLTAYADTDAAIRAINEVRLDHYLMKPWDPPEERLYPILNDLLDDWEASFSPREEEVRILGHRLSAEAHQIRDFLTRNLVPYRWVDVEGDEGRELLGLAGSDPDVLPLALFPDGSSLRHPTSVQLAERIGLKLRPGLPFYDLVIVGAGPAGLAAAVYGASEGLKTVLIEASAPGGQAGTSARIENYLGFPVGLSGGDLTRRAFAQAARFGAEILTPLEATGVRVDAAYRFVSLSDGSEVSCHALLIATGVAYRTLDVSGIAKLAGAGVYYGAAITEALEARGQDVIVLGGGNSAGQAAMYLAKYARSVTLVVRGRSLGAGMSQYLVAQIEAWEKIRVLLNVSLLEAMGDGELRQVRIQDSSTQAEQTLDAQALFIFIGARPHTEWLGGLVARDPEGFILSGPHLPRRRKRADATARREPFWLETSVPGIFVAGDVRHGSVKRVASAVGEGAMAVQFVHQYLETL